MLERLIIRGFQKHERLTVDFNPGITTIVGTNEAGKSSIIRALRWVCLNDAPADFINWEVGRARVKLIVDGHTIVRARGKENTYAIDGELLKSFRFDVPQAVAQVLNLADLNFQQQHDSHFWLSLSAGQVSRELNQIVNLSVIDDTLSITLVRLRKASTNVELVSDRLDSARKEVKSLKWTVEADVQLSKLERLEASIEEERSSVEELSGIISQAQKYQAMKGRLADAVTRGRELVVLGDEVMKLTEEVEWLEALVCEGSKLLKVKRLVIPNIDEMVSLYHEVNQLQGLIDEYEQKAKQVCQIKAQISTAEQALAKVKGCPVCGSPLRFSAPTSTCPTAHQ